MIPPGRVGNAARLANVGAGQSSRDVLREFGRHEAASLEERE